MNLEFTENQAYSAPKIYLCNPDKKELCLITGVNRKCTLRLNSIFTNRRKKIVIC